MDMELSRTFVELPSFMASWKNLGLTDSDLRRLQLMLLGNPKIGAVLQGANGIRKVRFAYENRGKSGSVRVIYVDFEVYEKIFLLAVYAKAAKENLTPAERRELGELVEILEYDLERGGWKNAGG